MQTEDLMLEQILGLCDSATALARALAEEACVPRIVDHADSAAASASAGEAIFRAARSLPLPV